MTVCLSVCLSLQLSRHVLHHLSTARQQLVLQPVAMWLTQQMVVLQTLSNMMLKYQHHNAEV